MTRHSQTLLAALAALSLAACSPGGFTGGGGDDDDDGIDAGGNPGGPDAGPAGPNARALFDDTVAPIMTAKCATAGCHGGAGTSPLKFLPPVELDYYDVVVSYDDRVVGYFDKAIAPILRIVDPGPHYVTYTPAESQLIADWLDAELLARQGGTPPPPGTPTPGELSKQLIREWSGCLELLAVQETNVADEWAGLGSSEGPCIRCHINGQASFIATDDDQRWFDVVSSNKYFMITYFTPNVLDLANPRMEINYDEFLRVGNAEFPFLEHPQFNGVDSDAIAALEALYTRTMERKAAGLCDPPRITDP
jgi:hypothetical protein